MSGAAICEAALKAVEKSRNIYLDKYTTWLAELQRLTAAKDAAEIAYNTADQALADTPTNQTINNTSRGAMTSGDECADWSASECDTRCNWRTLTTPGGKKSKWSYDRPECKYTWGYTKCVCNYVDAWDKSDATEKKTLFDQLKRDLENHISQEPRYKDNSPPTVQCCSNDLDCRWGTCYGNIQNCRSLINNISQNEDASKVIESIRVTDILFNKLNNKFNDYKITFDNYYNSFTKINFKQKNVDFIYNQIKTVYDNITVIFNQIEKNVVNILIYNGDLIDNNSKIPATSSYKVDSTTILNHSTSKTEKITSEYKIIVLLYVEIVNMFDEIERDKQNYNLIINKKGFIDENINNFNKNIESINDIYSEINSKILNSNEDLQKILELNNEAININNKIIIYKNSINEKVKEIKTLNDTISPKSIYFNITKDVYIANENTNILVNTKFIELKEIINNINNITITKKTNYEIQKKINDDNKILYALEEEENKKNSDILLLQLIDNEEKNKLLKSYNQTTPINITDITDITQLPISTPLPISTQLPTFTQLPISTQLPIYISEETAKIDYTLYIIIGVVVIIIIFLFKNK